MQAKRLIQLIIPTYLYETSPKPQTLNLNRISVNLLSAKERRAR